MQLASDYSKSKIEPYSLTLMLIHFITLLNRFDCDKSEYIETINHMIKNFIGVYNRDILRKKADLSANEFLLKNEEYVVNLMLICKALYESNRDLK